MVDVKFIKVKPSSDILNSTQYSSVDIVTAIEDAIVNYMNAEKKQTEDGKTYMLFQDGKKLYYNYENGTTNMRFKCSFYEDLDNFHGSLRMTKFDIDSPIFIYVIQSKEITVVGLENALASFPIIGKTNVYEYGVGYKDVYFLSYEGTYDMSSDISLTKYSGYTGDTSSSATSYANTLHIYLDDNYYVYDDNGVYYSNLYCTKDECVAYKGYKFKNNFIIPNFYTILSCGINKYNKINKFKSNNMTYIALPFYMVIGKNASTTRENEPGIRAVFPQTSTSSSYNCPTHPIVLNLSELTPIDEEQKEE